MELLKQNEIKELTENYPLYSQDDKKGDAIALYHFYVGSADWYVLEGSQEGEINGKDDITLYGLVSMGDVEFGYFSLLELENAKIPYSTKNENGKEIHLYTHIERDENFEPTKLKDLKTNEYVTEFLKRLNYK